jgi:ribosome-associated toxin RatA of RatAB toxin-antitoxin module
VRSTIGIDVEAPAALVFGLARDIERWPDLLPHYVSARRQSARAPDDRLLVRFVARRPLVPVLGLGLPVAWRALTWAEPAALRLRFVHRGGATGGMDVTWRIAETAHERCRVEIEHDFRPRMPGWAWLIDRAFTRPIAGRTLATFRTLAEAVVRSERSAPSVEAPATNPTT